MEKFSMNNGVNIYYDDKTTELIKKHRQLLADYETILWDKIKQLEFTSKQDKVNIFRDDPTRVLIEQQIAKIQNLSIPMLIEIVDFDKDK